MEKATPSPPKDATASSSSSPSPLKDAMQSIISAASPDDVRVSVQEIVSETDEVLICSSNSSFRRKSIFMRGKNAKSRLLDQEEYRPTSQTDQKKDKSQLLGKESPTMKYNALWIMQSVSFILLITAIVSSLSLEKLKKKKFFDLSLWKWELMLLVLISGRVLSEWGISIIFLLIERKMLLRKRVSYYLYTMRTSVVNTVWLALVLIVWVSIFDGKVKKVRNAHVLTYLSEILVCLLVGAMIWLVKTLGVMILESSFHVSMFFDRVQEALFSQYVIEILSLVGVQKLECTSEETSERIIGIPTDSKLKNGITMDILEKMNQKNVSSWNMKKLIKIVRKGVLSTQDEDDQKITSVTHAKSIAKKIFLNVAKPGSKHIYLEDLMHFIREDEALKILHLLEEDGTEQEKKISKRAFKNWMVSAFKERKALALSLDDTKTAIKKLQQMLNVIVGILTVAVCLLILKITTTKFLIFMGSQVLLAVFMFGNTCKTIFEAIIFLFVMHPFDVGDRVEIDGIQMIVEEMNILKTVFLKFDNVKVYYPNSVLFTKPINNFYRSPDMDETIDFCIHISTSEEKIVAMKERITRYVDKRSDHWHPDPLFIMKDVEDLNKLKISLWLSHRMNHQDMTERWTRRSRLVEEMVRTFRELDMEYRMLPLDVNIRNISSSRLPSNWTACAP